MISTFKYHRIFLCNINCFILNQLNSGVINNSMVVMLTTNRFDSHIAQFIWRRQSLKHESLQTNPAPSPPSSLPICSLFHVNRFIFNSQTMVVSTYVAIYPLNNWNIFQMNVQRDRVILIAELHRNIAINSIHNCKLTNLFFNFLVAKSCMPTKTDSLIGINSLIALIVHEQHE